MPKLYGHAEFASALGWDQRKLATYTHRGVMPEPHQRLAAGPIWTEEQVHTELLRRGKMIITAAEMVQYDERLHRVDADLNLGEVQPDDLHELEDAVVVGSALQGWDPYTHVLALDAHGSRTYYLATVEPKG